MKIEYDFFIIEREHLENKKTFPFHIYVFNPVLKNYSLFLNGNRPLTNEIEDFLDYVLKKGGKIAILKNQQITFLTNQGLHESQIPSLKERELHVLEKERNINIKLKETYTKTNKSFSFQTEFELACASDNFQKIIEYTKMEVLTFSVTQSPTISLALQFAKTYLNNDTFLNRIVAVSYFLAKTANIVDLDALADIICGTYLSHIGYTQLPLSLLKTSTLLLNDRDKKMFEKHTILGNHLIKKCNLEITDRCKKIILDHHERINGSGYPSMKNGESIEFLSLIVGSVTHLFEFSSGKINGNKMEIKNIISTMKDNHFITGLEIDYGETIFNHLVSLINTDKAKENKTA